MGTVLTEVVEEGPTKPEKEGLGNQGAAGSVRRWKRRPRNLSSSNGPEHAYLREMGKRHALGLMDGETAENGRGSQKRRVESMEIELSLHQTEEKVAGPTSWTLGGQ
ncbi:unnamed protein product [Amaranthus hypochondriacus]